MAAYRHDWTATLDNPEVIALRALGFVSSDRDQLNRLLLHTGMTRTDLTQQPIAQRHLAAILDFLLSNETTLLKFSRAVDLPPEAAYEARRLFNHTGKGH
jgi:hypothetical protein